MPGGVLRIFAGVEAMRGVAALSVVCGHAVSVRPDMVGPGLAGGALTILASGVDIFFVISGFIIATTAAAQRDPLNFAFRRAVRIYPVYWLVLLAAFVSSSWIELSPEERPALDFGLIFAWTYPNWYLGPAWSIAFELHFYAAVAAILGIAYLLRSGGLRFSRRNLAISAGLFVAGWYWIFVHGSADPQFARVPTYGLAAGLLIHAVVSAEIEGQSFSPILQWFGKISYSLYIVHYLVMKWIVNFTGLWLLSTAGTIIASILLSIGLAAALHIIIEAPLISWGRKWSLMRRDQRTSDVPRQEGTVRIPARAE